MENREQKILSEIKDMMGTIRAQLELLDAKMAELQQCVDPEDFENNPIEVELDVVDDDLPFDDVPAPAVLLAAEEHEEIAQVADVAEDPEPELEPEAEPEVESEIEPETVAVPEPEPVVEPEPVEVQQPVLVQEEDDDDDLPGVFDQPVTVLEAARTSPKSRPSVADAMVAEMQPWRTDMPGSTVKDVRSAISLNDRIIFINYLFNEDPLLFQDTIVKINTMNTLDEVVDYVKEKFPDWDLSSELVYRFMMAVRRRVK